MIYTIVTTGGNIILKDKVGHEEFDEWLSDNRCYIIHHVRRRHATSKTAPDELVCYVTLYVGRRRR